MKRFFLLFGFIFSCAFCFAFPRVSQFVEVGTGYVVAKNVERDFNPFNFTYGIEEKNENFLNFAPNFKALASVQFSDKIFDFTTLGTYFIPQLGQETESQKIGFGAEFIYHFQRYYDLYSEHDIYLESVFRLVLKDRLFFLANLGSGFKFAQIDAVDRDFLWDFSLSGSVALNYYFDCGAEIYGSVVSHSLYRYPLAFTPLYSLGFAWNFKSGFRLSSDFCLRLRDQFVVTPYIDRYEWNLKARFSF
ncbi:hypothetical protein [uncultured Treponema sp.]|uniref:hypothetical protein n=1 Tax=uncultured Treponema sp. TaxID=162155 RepID=UPI000E9E1D5F|nr:hypothetical protein [uncultured Treponema sp.]HAZ96171.1 hypothetical protein [Treponema sp.]